MAEDAGRLVTSTSLLLAVVLAASAATCLCAPSAAPADDVGTARPDRGATFASSSRFLATAAVARKIAGRACRAGYPGASCAGHLRCCGRACTDVLTSGSNCGACGKRCPFGRLCCAGRCVAAAYDAENCGACGRACAAGVPCTYAMCGYA